MNFLTRLLVAGTLLVVIGGRAQADGFPTRPVTLIVPFPAGGSTDAVLRALACASKRHLGQPMMIETARVRSASQRMMRSASGRNRATPAQPA